MSFFDIRFYNSTTWNIHKPCAQGAEPSVTRDTFSKGGKFLLKSGKKRWKIFFARRWKIKVENHIKKELDIFPPGLTFLASVFWTFLTRFSDPTFPPGT